MKGLMDDATLNELIVRLAVAEASCEAAAGAVPADAWDQVIHTGDGAWPRRQLLGHMAANDLRQLVRIRIGAGVAEPGDTEEHSAELEVHDWNRARVAERAGHGIDDLVAEMRANRQALIALLRRLTPVQRAGPMPFRGEPTPLEEMVPILIGHLEQHALELLGPAAQSELDYGLLDRAGADRMAFYPRPERRPAPAGATDYQVEVEPGVSLGARLYAAGPQLPTILYFHGNGEIVPDHDGLASYYAGSGANLFVFEFRGYGTSNGRPTFATLVSDARKIVAFFHASLDELGFTGCRLVMGRSLGAHSALEVAANAADRIAGLIIESGAGDVRRFLARLGVDPASNAGTARLAEGHEAKIRSITLPTLIIHGAEDELVLASRAIELHSMLGTPCPELLIIPGAGHNDLTWVAAREYFGAIGAFVGRVCGS
jgi:hypothetical protein